MRAFFRPLRLFSSYRDRARTLLESMGQVKANVQGERARDVLWIHHDSVIAGGELAALDQDRQAARPGVSGHMKLGVWRSEIVWACSAVKPASRSRSPRPARSRGQRRRQKGRAAFAVRPPKRGRQVRCQVRVADHGPEQAQCQAGDREGESLEVDQFG